MVCNLKSDIIVILISLLFFLDSDDKIKRWLTARYNFRLKLAPFLIKIGPLLLFLLVFFIKNVELFVETMSYYQFNKTNQPGTL